MFSWHTLGPFFVPIGHRLNATAYLSIVSYLLYSLLSDKSFFLHNSVRLHLTYILHHVIPSKQYNTYTSNTFTVLLISD